MTEQTRQVFFQLLRSAQDALAIGRFAAAADLLGKAKSNPEFAGYQYYVLATEGDLLKAQAKWADALKVYCHIIDEVSPCSYLAWTQKAVCLFELGHYQEAFDTTLTAEHWGVSNRHKGCSQPEVFSVRGRILCKLTRFEEALQNFEAAANCGWPSHLTDPWIAECCIQLSDRVAG